MSEWQPIKTAPKDGTEILVYLDSPGRAPNDRMVVAWRQEMSSGASTWAFCQHKPGCYLVLLEPVSHWMPLPPPPSEAPA